MSWIEIIGIWLKNYSSPQGTIYVSLDVHHLVLKQLNLFSILLYTQNFTFYSCIWTKSVKWHTIIDSPQKSILQIHWIDEYDESNRYSITKHDHSEIIQSTINILESNSNCSRNYSLVSLPIQHVIRCMDISFTVMHLIRNIKM